MGLSLKLISPVLQNQLLNQTLSSDRLQYCLLPRNLPLPRPYCSREHQSRTRQRCHSPHSLPPSLNPPFPPALLNLRDLSGDQVQVAGGQLRSSVLQTVGEEPPRHRKALGLCGEQTPSRDPVRMEPARARMLGPGAAISQKLPVTTQLVWLSG